MNPDLRDFELQAERNGYFKSCLQSYEKLHKATYDRHEVAKTQEQKAYWSFLAKLEYCIFETLYSAHQIVANPGTDAPLTRLPDFMARYCSVLDVNDYVKTLIVVHSIPKRELTRQSFESSAPNLKGASKLMKSLADFKTKHHRADGYKSDGSHLALRNFFVHRFRPLWWHNHGQWGFPKAMLQSEQTMYDELWKQIQDANTWEHSVTILSSNDFISAGAILKNVHDHEGDIAEHVFQIILKEINSLPF
jgi:hypothetical protein